MKTYIDCQLQHVLERMENAPLSRPVAGVERVDALVYQSIAICAAHNLLQLLRNFTIVRTRQDPYDRRHRPCISWAIVRPSNRADHRSTHEVRIIRAQDQCTSVLVRFVIDVEIAVERSSEQRRDIGVVHDVLTHIAIDFIRVEAAIFLGSRDRMRLDRLTETLGQFAHLLGKLILATDQSHDLCTWLEVGGEHHVARDQELEYRGVVGWSKERSNEASATVDWIA